MPQCVGDADEGAGVAVPADGSIGITSACSPSRAGVSGCTAVTRTTARHLVLLYGCMDRRSACTNFRVLYEDRQSVLAHSFALATQQIKGSLEEYQGLLASSLCLQH